MHLMRLVSSASTCQWVDKVTQARPCITSERLDPARAQQLIRTLPTRQGARETAQSGQLQPGHHLGYFQPETWLDDLGPDGSSPEYNPPAPYTRRMWAGGEMQWRGRALSLGSEVTQAVSVPSVELKSGMLFVRQQRDLYAEGVSDVAEWSVREMRTHVFRQADAVKSATTPRSDPAPARADHSFRYTPTSPLLFRFSALTFNGHKIHYDLPWTQQVEGHPALVVHGPLTALLLVELAGQVARGRGLELHKFSYRATSPMYVDRDTRLGATWQQSTAGGAARDGNVLRLWAEQGGHVGMHATMTCQ